MTPLTLMAAAIMPPADNQNEPAAVGVIDVPVGFRATNAIFNGSEMMVLGLAASPNGIRVPHKVMLIRLGDTVQLPIGIKLGAYIGTVPFPDPSGSPRPAQVFVYGEWPTSTLMAANALGVA